MPVGEGAGPSGRNGGNFAFPFCRFCVILADTAKMNHDLASMFSHQPQVWSRRRFLARNAMGLGSVALAWLLREENLLATPPNMPRQPQSFDLKPKASPLRPQARAMISLFMHGGPSHIDLFDPKPELSKRSGEDYQGEVTFSFVDRASKKLFGSPWKFQKHGQSGIDVSELLP